MYDRRVIIFSRDDSKYALYGSVCGMAKFVSYGNGTTVTIQVNNLKQGNWWGIALIEGKPYAVQLNSFAQGKLEVGSKVLANVGFLLVQGGDNPVVVAEGYLGNKQINYLPKGKLFSVLQGDATQYEQFVEQTENFYPKEVAVDVETLKEGCRQKYQALQDYSSAFERYYATGRGDNYLQSVSNEIKQLFDKFPPHFPLINKYPNSYFVKINFPNSEKYFVMGLLVKDGQPKYICYALPGESNVDADKDFVFVKSPNQGFWMLCQDAQNGQITTLR